MVETKREESTILDEHLNHKEISQQQELHVNVSSGRQEAGHDTEIDLEDEPDSVVDEDPCIKQKEQQ